LRNRHNKCTSQRRLDGVDYTFLDKFMVYVDNYKISSQLAKAMNEFELHMVE